MKRKNKFKRLEGNIVVFEDLGIYNSNSEKVAIPIPPLEIQKEIVEEIEGYQKIIENLKRDIEENEQKIKNKIATVWGE